MHQDFHAKDLRGHSFKGQNLTGANFDHANIQGADFTNAVLVGTNFSQAKAGLQRFWLFAIAATTAVLAALTGLILGYGGAFPSFISLLLAENTNSVGKGSLLLFGFLVLVIFFAILIRRGLGAALGLFTVSVAAITAVISFVGADNSALIAAAVVQAVVIAIVPAGVLIGALTLTVAVIINKTVTPVLVGTCALVGTISGVLEGIKGTADGNRVANLAMSGMLAIVLLTLSIYIAHRVVTGDRKYAVIRTLAINLCAIGGTSFRNANLTDADFSQANLKHTDFRKANLTRTCWFLATQLDLSRIEGTYLDNPALRQLAISKNGQDRVYDDENLRGLNLQDAMLEGSSFIRADLSEANLRNADLTKAKLAEAQLYGTDLSNACLTKACIQDWAISTDTQLEDIRCEEIYMRLPTVDDPDPWRKPDSRNETFKEGDFTDFIAPIMKTLDLYRQQNVDPRQIGSTLKTLDLYHYEGINPAAAAIALKNLAEENPDAGLEVVALEGRGEEKIHLQAVVTGIGDSSRLSAEYSEMYRKIASLPQRDIQTLLVLISEKDDRIRSLEKILTTAKEGNNTYYIQAGRDISGVLNLGTISGNVSNAIGQLSTVSETE